MKAARVVTALMALLLVGSILGAHPKPARARVTSPTAADVIAEAAIKEATCLFGCGPEKTSVPTSTCPN